MLDFVFFNPYSDVPGTGYSPLPGHHRNDPQPPSTLSCTMKRKAYEHDHKTGHQNISTFHREHRTREHATRARQQL